MSQAGVQSSQARQGVRNQELGARDQDTGFWIKSGLFVMPWWWTWACQELQACSSMTRGRPVGAQQLIFWHKWTNRNGSDSYWLQMRCQGRIQGRELQPVPTIPWRHLGCHSSWNTAEMCTDKRKEYSLMFARVPSTHCLLPGLVKRQLGQGQE